MKIPIFILFIIYNVSFAQAQKESIMINVMLLNETPTKQYTDVQNLFLTSKQTTILIELIVKDSSNLNNYYYQIEGLTQDWASFRGQNKVIVSNLLGGKYRFIVANKNHKPINSFSFEVELFIWQHWWFLPVGFLFVSGIIGMILYLFALYRLRQQLQLQSVRHELEMDALRAQMNPHFIFNCLNTIDSYILLNKTDEASEFLNKFSKLIRRILESSRNEYIPIEQDIDALELYIKLEQERSNPKFLYKISIDESLQANEYFIPSMLIQPFVENAILHGLRHKRDAVGELFLNFKVLDNQLVITLIDNGIGREASQKINSFKQLNKQSVGLKLTEERITKLNEMYEGKAFLSVTDINQDNDRGTIVKIGLPLISQNDLSGR